MKVKASLIKASIYFFAFLLVQSSFIMMTPLSKIFNSREYKIRSSSSLKVNGKTNINTFSCTSLESNIKGELSYQFEPGSAFTNFQNTQLKIAIHQLDCGAKLINNDLYKALRADEYPNISIDLIRLVNLDNKLINECNSWVSFEALTDMTIVCTSQSVIIPVRVKKIDHLSYRILGSKMIELCDFGIEPPTAMMGLIKVNSTIEIEFDLIIDLE